MPPVLLILCFFLCVSERSAGMCFWGLLESMRETVSEMRYHVRLHPKIKSNEKNREAKSFLTLCR